MLGVGAKYRLSMPFSPLSLFHQHKRCNSMPSLSIVIRCGTASSCSRLASSPPFLCLHTRINTYVRVCAGRPRLPQLSPLLSQKRMSITSFRSENPKMSHQKAEPREKGRERERAREFSTFDNNSCRDGFQAQDQMTTAASLLRRHD